MVEMRQLLDDATMIYRQELDSFLTIVAPAAVLGPVLIIVAASGFVQALVTLPIFLLLLLLTYAACVRAAAQIQRHLSPDPVRAWIEALASVRGAVITGGMPALGLVVTTGCALWIGGDGLPLIAFAVGLAGVAAFVHWTLRHAYDESLVLAHDFPAPEAMRVGPLLASLDERWTPSLLAATAAPLIAGVLLSFLAAEALALPVGGAVFLLVFAFWLPLPALALTIDCDRLLVEATEPAQRAAR